MKRTVSLVAVVLLLALSGPVHAQIKIDKKPAPAAGPDEVVVYTWTSSWGLRDDPPNKYPLGIATHKTEAEAVAAAKAHMLRTAGNGNLAVTHYLIEGEPSVRNKMAHRAETAKELLHRVKEAKKALDGRKLGDTLKEYKDMVGESYRQALAAKKTITGGVISLTDGKMREVNGLIDQYNREVNDFRSVMGQDADLGFSPLARVTRETEVDALVGTTWAVEGNVPADKYTFQPDGKVLIDLPKRVATVASKSYGSWKREGDTITVRYEDRRYYQLMLQGSRMTGGMFANDGERLRDWAIRKVD